MEIHYHVRLTVLDVTGNSPYPEGHRWPGDRIAMAQGHAESSPEDALKHAIAGLGEAGMRAEAAHRAVKADGCTSECTSNSRDA